MDVKALRRLTGDYGTVNEGDTMTVSDAVGEQLIADKLAEATTSVNESATPEQISARNNEGAKTDEGVHVDGTNREILNTGGRKLHESGPEATQEAEARVEAEVEPALNDAPISKGDEEVREKHDNDDIAKAKAKKAGKTITSADAE